MVKENKKISTLKKGISTVTIFDIHNVPQQQINTAKFKLMKQHTNDDDTAKILAEDQNFQKLKNRISMEAFLNNKKGETLIKANRYTATPEEGIQELRKIKEGEENKKGEYGIKRKLKLNKWIIEQTDKTGTIDHINLRITFVKA